MSHYCQAALIACEDFRLHQRADGRNCIVEFIKNLGVDCDLITRAGSIQDLVRPASPTLGGRAEPDYEKVMLRDLAVAANLHNVSTIYLVNHEDCGAYAAFQFASREAELEQHRADLRAAKEIINKEFPGKEIKLYFAELEPGSGDNFLIKEAD